VMPPIAAACAKGIPSEMAEHIALSTFALYLVGRPRLAFVGRFRRACFFMVVKSKFAHCANRGFWLLSLTDLHTVQIGSSIRTRVRTGIWIHTGSSHDACSSASRIASRSKRTIRPDSRMALMSPRFSMRLMVVREHFQRSASSFLVRY